MRGWTFLTHHAHVLLALNSDSNRTIDELAQITGLTSRSVMNVLRDLEDGGYLHRQRQGRNNSYLINHEGALRHPTSESHTVGELIRALGTISH
jgi:DNA-binding transcriptional ArsR family regulator